MTDNEMYNKVKYMERHFLNKKIYYPELDDDDIIGAVHEGIAIGIQRYKENPKGDWLGFCYLQIRSYISRVRRSKQAQRNIPKALKVSMDAEYEDCGDCEDEISNLHETIPDTTTVDEIERIELRDMLIYCISRLHSRRHLFIINGYLNGLTWEEMADQLGVSVSTVYQNYEKTIKYLRMVWKDELNRRW
jgi:RNA polymerase sigma factor (sigma-70 family)